MCYFRRSYSMSELSKYYYRDKPCPYFLAVYKNSLKPKLTGRAAEALRALEAKDYSSFYAKIKYASPAEKLSALKAAFYLENNNIRLLNGYAFELIEQKKGEEALKLLLSCPVFNETLPQLFGKLGIFDLFENLIHLIKYRSSFPEEDFIVRINEAKQKMSEEVAKKFGVSSSEKAKALLIAAVRLP